MTTLQERGLWLYRGKDQRMYNRQCLRFDVSVTSFALSSLSSGALGPVDGTQDKKGLDGIMSPTTAHEPPMPSHRNWSHSLHIAKATLRARVHMGHLWSVTEGKGGGTVEEGSQPSKQCFTFSFLPLDSQATAPLPYHLVNDKFRPFPPSSLGSPLPDPSTCTLLHDESLMLVLA